MGPAFDCVAAWHGRGVPLRVACAGIDRCVDRLAAKGPRRRPVRVEFCDADVLDAFDDWRRAVGVPLSESFKARRLQLRRGMNATLYILGFVVVWSVAVRYDDRVAEDKRTEAAAAELREAREAARQCTTAPLVASREP